MHLLLRGMLLIGVVGVVLTLIAVTVLAPILALVTVPGLLLVVLGAGEMAEWLTGKEQPGLALSGFQDL